MTQKVKRAWFWAGTIIVLFIWTVYGTTYLINALN